MTNALSTANNRVRTIEYVTSMDRTIKSNALYAGRVTADNTSIHQLGATFRYIDPVNDGDGVFSVFTGHGAEAEVLDSDNKDESKARKRGVDALRSRVAFAGVAMHNVMYDKDDDTVEDKPVTTIVHGITTLDNGYEIFAGDRVEFVLPPVDPSDDPTFKTLNKQRMSLRGRDELDPVIYYRRQSDAGFAERYAEVIRRPATSVAVQADDDLGNEAAGIRKGLADYNNLYMAVHDWAKQLKAVFVDDDLSGSDTAWDGTTEFRDIMTTGGYPGYPLDGADLCQLILNPESVIDSLYGTVSVNDNEVRLRIVNALRDARDCIMHGVSPEVGTMTSRLYNGILAIAQNPKETSAWNLTYSSIAYALSNLAMSHYAMLACYNRQYIGVATTDSDQTSKFNVMIDCA